MAEPRLAADRLAELARQFPAVLVLGARQTGKNTLVRTVFAHLPYVDLEDPRQRELFSDDPRFHVEQRSRP